MTDTTDNLFAEMFDMQAGHDMVIVRAEDAREVMALLGDALMEVEMWHDMMQDVTDNATNIRTEELITRIERVLAAQEPREKAVSA